MHFIRNNVVLSTFFSFVTEVHKKQNLADKTINFPVMLFLIIRSKLECQIHVHMQFSKIINHFNFISNL